MSRRGDRRPRTSCSLVVQILNPTFDEQLDGFVDYLDDGAFTGALITIAIALRGVQLVFGAPRRAVVIIAVGQLLVAFLGVRMLTPVGSGRLARL